nr:uncharacterized protein LOC106689803 [Halyomorpha halys]
MAEGDSYVESILQDINNGLEALKINPYATYNSNFEEVIDMIKTLPHENAKMVFRLAIFGSALERVVLDLMAHNPSKLSNHHVSASFYENSTLFKNMNLEQFRLNRSEGNVTGYRRNSSDPFTDLATIYLRILTSSWINNNTDLSHIQYVLELGVVVSDPYFPWNEYRKHIMEILNEIDRALIAAKTEHKELPPNYNEIVNIMKSIPNAYGAMLFKLAVFGSAMERLIETHVNGSGFYDRNLTSVIPENLSFLYSIQDQNIASFIPENTSTTSSIYDEDTSTISDTFSHENSSDPFTDAVTNFIKKYTKNWIYKKSDLSHIQYMLDIQDLINDPDFPWEDFKIEIRNIVKEINNEILSNKTEVEKLTAPNFKEVLNVMKSIPRPYAAMVFNVAIFGSAMERLIEAYVKESSQLNLFDHDVNYDFPDYLSTQPNIPKQAFWEFQNETWLILVMANAVLNW